MCTGFCVRPNLFSGLARENCESADLKCASSARILSSVLMNASSSWGKVLENKIRPTHSVVGNRNVYLHLECSRSADPIKSSLMTPHAETFFRAGPQELSPRHYRLYHAAFYRFTFELSWCVLTANRYENGFYGSGELLSWRIALVPSLWSRLVYFSVNWVKILPWQNNDNQFHSYRLYNKLPPGQQPACSLLLFVQWQCSLLTHTHTHMYYT